MQLRGDLLRFAAAGGERGVELGDFLFERRAVTAAHLHLPFDAKNDFVAMTHQFVNTAAVDGRGRSRGMFVANDAGRRRLVGDFMS